MADEIQYHFSTLLHEHGLDLTEDQLKQFELYYEELVTWNEKINLTAITEREQVYIKHFYDSLSLSFYIPLAKTSTIADIGSGAGFPGIPLKICYPHLQLTIVDSLNKRIVFLKQLVEKLGLTGVHCVHGRAEDVARDKSYRDVFDLVTARAVARLAVLNEFCLPFVRTGGIFAAMKGSGADEELQEASYSLQQLHGKIDRIERFELPLEASGRQIIIIEKTGTTPAKYPRKAGTPLKDPLMKKS
jgi:16S rRNA (guanine527-N7)-methyltransferase